MKLRIRILLTAILCLGCLGTWNVYSQRRSASRWEYKFVEIDRQQSPEVRINALAEQGWELVTVQPVGNSDRYVFYLRHPK